MHSNSDATYRDDEILAWIASGEAAQLTKAVTTLASDRRLVRSIRRRVRQKLESRQMLFPDQVYYLADAEEEALAWIFDRALSVQSLRRTVLERGKGEHGVGFDPTQGSLHNWLLNAAGYQLLDWLKKHRRSTTENTPLNDQLASPHTTEPSAEDTASGLHQAMIQTRDRFRLLPSMQRACMTIKYLLAEVLEDEDLICISTERGDSDPSPETLEQLRTELQSLYVARLAHWVETSSTNSNPPKSMGLRAKQERVDVLFAKRQQLEDELAAAARQLKATGRSQADLDELQSVAIRWTLQEIKERFSNRWTDERILAESAQRLVKVKRQLRAAQEQLKAATESADGSLPPAEIAKFLEKSVNAVSSALSRAHKKLGRFLGMSWDEDENDAREPDDPP